MKKKGSVSIYITFLIVAIVIILIAAVAAPLGVRFTSEMYAAGDKILLDSLPAINSINDTNISSRINNSINLARDAGEYNIEVMSDMFQYGWIIAIALVALVIFLFTRRLVEVGGGGFV